MSINSINPANGQILRSFELLSDPEIHEKLQCATNAFPGFRNIAFADRAKMMNKAGEILEADQEHIARLATTEMGKTLRSARDEVAKCAWACRYYAEHGERLLQSESVATDARRSYVCSQAETTVICQPDRFRSAGYSKHGRDRTKKLFAIGGRIGWNVH